MAAEVFSIRDLNISLFRNAWYPETFLTEEKTNEVIDKMFNRLVNKITKIYLENYGPTKEKRYHYLLSELELKTMLNKIYGHSMHSAFDLLFRRDDLKEDALAKWYERILLKVERVYTGIFYDFEKIFKEKKDFSKEISALRKEAPAYAYKLLEPLDESPTLEDSIFIRSETPVDILDEEDLDKFKAQLESDEKKIDNINNSIQLLIQEKQTLSDNLSVVEICIAPLDKKKHFEHKKLSIEQRDRLAELNEKKSKICTQIKNKEKEISEFEKQKRTLEISVAMTKKKMLFQ